MDISMDISMDIHIHGKPDNQSLTPLCMYANAVQVCRKRRI